MVYSYELKHATRNFVQTNFLGQGAFGKVFKAILSLSDVAIKNLKPVRYCIIYSIMTFMYNYNIVAIGDFLLTLQN